jgi:hypothetical protein
VRAAAKPAQAKGKPAANPKPKLSRLTVVSSGAGIVQRVLARGLVVRVLDGSIVGVKVAAKSTVTVNGAAATLADVRPGFVVRFAGAPGRAVRVLRALDPSPPRSGAATVVSVGADAVVVSTAGGTVTVRVNARTRIVVDGNDATLADVAPGDLVLLGGAAASARKPVRVLRVRRAG